MTLHPKLSHLSSDQLEALMARYYSKENVGKLVEEYQVSIHPSGLSALFPPILLENIKCDFCSGSFYQKRPTKNNRWQKSIPKCTECNHTNMKDCDCHSCHILAEHKAKQQRVERERLITQRLKISNYGPNIAVNDLQPKDFVYFMSFYRLCAIDNILVSQPLSSTKGVLAPTSILIKKIIDYLKERELITVDPSSGEAIDLKFTDNGTISYSYTIDQVRYRLLIGENEVAARQYLNAIEEIAYAEKKPMAWMHEIYDLWKELALHECLAYFAHTGAKHTFNVPLGEKTQQMFETLLKRFSVAEIYCCIYCAAKNAASFYLTEKPYKQHAANSMVNGCHSIADKYHANGTRPKAFGRDFNCPKSSLSNIIHDVFLKNPNEFSTIIPDFHYLAS